MKVKRIKNREKNDTSAIKVCNNGSRDRHHHGSSQQAVCFTAQFDQRDPRVGKGNEYCYFQPEQAAILEDKYKGNPGGKKQFCVSTQHYSFAVNAFVDLIKQYGQEEYDFSLRETQTYEIIEDVARLRSEIGILFLNDFNEAVLSKLLKSHDLEFHQLFVASPHVFISRKHPLAGNSIITNEELEEYPYLSFEQGEHNSFYFSEEIFSDFERRKNIRVRDRATLFNLLIGLNGYTVCSGVIDKKLNGKDIIAVPLADESDMRIGYITHRKGMLSRLGTTYLEALQKYLG